MKKNVLRILLALVLVSLVFAMVACNGDKKPEEPDKTCNHVDANSDGKCDRCGETMPGGGDGKDDASLEEELGKILDTLTSYLEALKGVKKDSSIGIDLGIGGYYQAKENGGNFKVRAAANANATNPELALSVSVNNKDYFALGAQKNALYLLEGLNLINTTEKNSNKIKMDASYLEEGILNAASVGMEYLEWFASNILGDVNLGDLKEGIASFLPAVGDFIEATSDDNGATLTINEGNMQKLLAFLFAPGGVVIPEDVVATIDNVIETVAGYAAKAFPDYAEVLEGLTREAIVAEYAPALNIKAGYEGDAIKSIDIEIDLSAFELQLGLSIDLTTLSLEDEANISFSGYQAKDLNTSVKVDLDNKGISGVLDLVINTSSAFAALENNIASAQLKINGTNQAAVAAFDGDTIYLDMTNAFTALGASAPAATSFSYVISDHQQMKEVKDEITGAVTEQPVVDAKGEPVMHKNIKTVILDALTGLEYVEPTPAPKNAAEEEGSLGIWGTIYNILNGGVGGTASTTMDDVIVLLDTKIGKYLKFKIAENGKAKSIEAIVAEIVTIYEANKTALTDAVNAEGTEAGAQLFSGEGASLLTFVSKFIKIPALKEVEGKTEFDWDNEAEINDAATLKKYVAFAFEQYPSEGQYADYINTALIGKIVGLCYGAIIDGGIYAYAGYNAGEGLNGYIGLKANKEATDSYVEIGGSIGFIDAGNYATIPADITGTTDFTEITADKNEGDKDYYVVFGTTWALFDAFLNYGYTAE